MTEGIPLKWLASIVAGQSPTSTVVEVYDGDGLPFLQGNAEFGPEQPAPVYRCDSAHKRSSPGDILISVRAPVGALNVADRSYGIGRGLAAVGPGRRLDGRYCWWWLHSAVAELRAEATGSTYEAVTADDIGALRVPAKPLDRQRAIADFLDAETARIDALITRKRRQVELLEERFREAVRTALIRDQVFADPLAVERAHLADGWKPVRLGRDLAFGSGTTPLAGDPRYYGEGTPWIVTGNLRDAEISKGHATVTQEALAHHSALQTHPAGSLVVAMYGATVGRLGITTVRAVVNQACCVMHSGNDVDTRFLFLYLLVHRDVLIERSVGAGQPNISQEILRSLRIAVPARDVQARIVERYFVQREAYNSAIKVLNRQVALLQERRQALITAAVTGELHLAEAG